MSRPQIQVPRISAVPANALIRRLRVIIPVFAGAIAIGTLGYRILEDDYGWIDSVYQSVVTISTVGFGEVRPLSDESRIFTIVLILLGVSAFTYTFGTLGEYVIAGELRGAVRARRIRRKIEAIRNHYIVCGYGRMGARVVEELTKEGRKVVIVESDEAVVERLADDGYLVVRGDAGYDQTLADAHIETASRLIASTGSDATNLMVSLSARAFNPELFIVARVEDEANERKLLTAGANRVVALYRSSGRRMAQLALRPHAVEVSDVILGDQEIELSIEDMTVHPRSALLGRSLEDAVSGEGINAMVVAVRKPDGQLEPMPSPRAEISAGDVLVAFGTRDELNKLISLSGIPI